MLITSNYMHNSLHYSMTVPVHSYTPMYTDVRIHPCTLMYTDALQNTLIAKPH